MASNVYMYGKGDSIEVAGPCSALQGARAAVMQNGRCTLEGTLLECLQFLSAQGNEQAAQHARLFVASMRKVRDDRKRFRSRRTRSQ